MANIHPEDAIYKAKTFIQELQSVQTNYFDSLTSTLNLTQEGKDWLFDYVFNETGNYDDFEHYFTKFNKSPNDIYYANAAETFVSTDFGDFSPMLHMSSCEADMEPLFPLSDSNINEPFNLEVDCINHTSDNLNK